MTMPQVKGLLTLFQPLELLAWHVSRPPCKYSDSIVFSELIPLMITYILVLVSQHEWDETFHPSIWSRHSMYWSKHCQYPSDNPMTRNLLDIWLCEEGLCSLTSLGYLTDSETVKLIISPLNSIVNNAPFVGNMPWKSIFGRNLSGQMNLCMDDSYTSNGKDTN